MVWYGMVWYFIYPHNTDEYKTRLNVYMPNNYKGVPFPCKAHHHSHSSRHLHHVVQKAAVSTADSPKYNEATNQVLSFKQRMPKLDTDVFIGLSLCCGFVFMLLIDQLSGGHSHGPSNTGSLRFDSVATTN